MKSPACTRAVLTSFFQGGSMLNRAVVPWRVLPFVALLYGGVAAAQVQSSNVIRGQVTDSAAQRPIPGAEVFIVTAGGATRGARTDTEGRYTIAGVAAGEVRLRTRLIGYAPAERVLIVRDGQANTADFALTQRTTILDQVVVTGTGGAVERRAVGNVIETIDAAAVMQSAPIRSVEQLIGARTPGVIVMPSTGQVGTGANIRVRSVGSLSLGTDPIIYIDGVRMDADVNRGPGQRGGAGASRLNDISPEDIESVEIIKGPAAATLYGTEASNGVIQIITKRGKSSAPRWEFTTRQGTNWLQNPEGRAGLLWARDPQGQLISFNLYQRELEQGNGPVFTNGRNQGYVLSLNGGTNASRYYLSTSYDNDVGVVPWNWDHKFSARANLDVEVSPKLRLQGSLGHIRDRIRLAQPGNINPDPFSNLVWGRWSNIATTGGFGFMPRHLWNKVENHADNDRTTTSLTAMYEPRSWFTHKLVAGLDVNSENNWTQTPRQTAEVVSFFGGTGLGQKSVERASRSFLSLDYAGNVKFDLGSSLAFTTSVGLQHYRSTVSGITATGQTFPASPILTVGATTTRDATEAYVANATVGMYVQQAAAWRDRVFVTAALRGDDNSAFGQDYSAAYYPKLSASWVISEESWWRMPVLNDLRLRGAFGAAGTQPGTFDASRLYASAPGYLNASGLVPSSFGNPELSPERSTELELGFETTLLNGRMDVSYTNFNRRVTDAIVNVPLPPSVGFPGSQTVNIGRVKAWGNELAANFRILQGRRVAWDVGTQLANNGNEILNIGASEFLNVGGGGTAVNRVGYSIADFFFYRVRSATLDATGRVLSAVCDGGTGKDGLRPGGPDAPCPIGTFTGTPAPRVYGGHSQPTWQAGFNTQVTLWENLRLYARVDGNGGHLQSNTEIRALHNQGSSKAVVEQNDPFLQTYRQIGGPEADVPGTYKAGFLKLRELSATYTINPSLIRRLGASGASISVAGRNLSTLYTEQHGWNTSRDGRIDVDIADRHTWDPEIRAVGSRSNGFQTILPPTSSFTTTLRLTF
jgi:TonB-linked SusC/RagA family outer membrane protein